MLIVKVSFNDKSVKPVLKEHDLVSVNKLTVIFMKLTFSKQPYESYEKEKENRIQSEGNWRRIQNNLQSYLKELLYHVRKSTQFRLLIYLS